MMIYLSPLAVVIVSDWALIVKLNINIDTRVRKIDFTKTSEKVKKDFYFTIISYGWENWNSFINIYCTLTLRLVKFAAVKKLPDEH